MDDIQWIQVDAGSSLVEVTASLAREIWQAHYVPIIGQAQVDYMLERYQTPEAIRAQINGGDVYYLISDAQGQPIGYVCLRVQDKELFLNRIYVHQPSRRKKAGKKTMDFVQGLARSHECSKIWLTVNKQNTGSIKFYKHCGFAITRAVVQEIGQGFVMDDYVMEKKM
jgi:ribosomal protein S18 acetylase RimI-like enzyme